MIVQIIGWFSIGGAIVAAGTASWRAYNSDDYFEPSLFYIAARCSFNRFSFKSARRSLTKSLDVFVGIRVLVFIFDFPDVKMMAVKAIC